MFPIFSYSQASNVVDISNISASSGGHQSLSFHGNNPSSVTLQISNLDTTIEENELKQCLINRLKPITTGKFYDICINFFCNVHANQTTKCTHHKQDGI